MMRRLVLSRLIPLAALSLASCASPTAVSQASEQPDPLERLNRSVYSVNTAVDSVTLKPVAKVYRAVVPKPARQGVSNFLGHIEEPWSGVNALAQGKVSRFFRAFDRLVINTLFGFGGLVDQAAKWGMPAQEEDLGQTLAVWGVPEGPYLMLPFFGPSNPRDFTGLVVQFFFDPKEYAIKEASVSGLGTAELGTRVLNFRTEALDTVDVLVESSTDPYAAIRSAYRQQRNFEINDGAVASQPAADDLFEDDPEPQPAPSETPASPPAAAPPSEPQQ